MIERLQMILEGLPADSDPFFDDERGFYRAECVPLDCIRRVSDLHVVVMFEISQRLGREGTQAIQPFFLRGDGLLQDRYRRFAQTTSVSLRAAVGKLPMR